MSRLSNYDACDPFETMESRRRSDMAAKKKKAKKKAAKRKANQIRQEVAPGVFVTVYIQATQGKRGKR